MLNAAAQQTGASGGTEWEVFVPLVAAAISFMGVFITLLVNGRRAERERLRSLYAKGWAAVQAYKEMAFAIRRRDGERRAAERVRLSEAMREIQKELSFYEALIGRERSGEVAISYRSLAAKTREIAGGIIRRSWNEEPISSDDQIHAPEIAAELEALGPLESAYLNAAASAVGGSAEGRKAVDAATETRVP